MNTMTESPYDVSITAAETQPVWCIRVSQRNAPVVPHQSEIGVFFLMTATTNSILLKPHSPPCEELASLRVHLYLNTPDKNELPVVVNWICRSTASSPQNVLCHKWIKLSLCDVKIFNTASGLLGFREIPHCWCILVLSSEGEKGSFFFFPFSFFLWFCLWACLSVWTFGLWSRVQRYKLYTIPDALLHCVQNEWLWVLTVCHTEIAIILIIRIPLRPLRNVLLWHSFQLCKGVINSAM